MNNQNPQGMVINLINGLHNSGKISNDQYDEIMKNQNNPQEIVSVLLKAGMVTDQQVSTARERAGTLFGIK